MLSLRRIQYGGCCHFRAAKCARVPMWPIFTYAIDRPISARLSSTCAGRHYLPRTQNYNSLALDFKRGAASPRAALLTFKAPGGALHRAESRQAAAHRSHDRRHPSENSTTGASVAGSYSGPWDSRDSGSWSDDCRELSADRKRIRLRIYTWSRWLVLVYVYLHHIVSQCDRLSTSFQQLICDIHVFK